MFLSNTKVAYDADTEYHDQWYNIDDFSTEVLDYISMVINAASVLKNDHDNRELIDIEVEVDQYISEVEKAAREEWYTEEVDHNDNMSDDDNVNYGDHMKDDDDNRNKMWMMK